MDREEEEERYFFDRSDEMSTTLFESRDGVSVRVMRGESGLPETRVEFPDPEKQQSFIARHKGLFAGLGIGLLLGCASLIILVPWHAGTVPLAIAIAVICASFFAGGVSGLTIGALIDRVLGLTKQVEQRQAVINHLTELISRLQESEAKVFELERTVEALQQQVADLAKEKESKDDKYDRLQRQFNTFQENVTDAFKKVQKALHREKKKRMKEQAMRKQEQERRTQLRSEIMRLGHSPTKATVAEDHSDSDMVEDDFGGESDDADAFLDLNFGNNNNNNNNLSACEIKKT